MKRSSTTQDSADNLIIKKTNNKEFSKIPSEELTKIKQDLLNSEDEEKTPSSKSDFLNLRLGKCEVCASKNACYTCPKCEVKTCCLDCVRIHKMELNCDGKRDRTKFIPLKQMTKMDFMSDYYFLEECTRYVEDRKTDPIKKYTRYNRDLPMHLNRLRNAAKERNITLKFLLQNFARHKENTTYFDWRTKKIWWRIKWIFVNAGNLCYTDEKCLEDKYLRDLLNKYVEIDNVQDNVPERRKLEYYQSKGVQNLKVLLKAEGIKRCKDRFYLLDVNKTLKANLAGKTLVEYPLIYISYEEDCSGGFDVIDSDEDVESEAKKHAENLETYRREMLEKQKQAKEENEDDADNEADVETVQKLAREKRRQERQRKRQEYEKVASNFLFTDEQLMEMLSSSSEEEVGLK